MVILLRCDVWACKGLLIEKKKLETWLLVCSGGLDAKVIESTKIPFMCKLFGVSCNLGTKPSQGVSHLEALTST
jgi:hypothetical protein